MAGLQLTFYHNKEGGGRLFVIRLFDCQQHKVNYGKYSRFFGASESQLEDNT